MDDSQVLQKLAVLETKIDAAYASAEKTRKYLLWSGIIAAALIIVPLLVMPFIVPIFLQSLALPAGY